MPGPRVDPNAPPPRIRPVFIALGLALTAVVGAAAVYLMGSDGLDRDRAIIERFGPIALERVHDMEAALIALEASRDDPSAAIPRVAAAGRCELSLGETVPEILEPLQASCEAAANAMRTIVDEVRRSPDSQLGPLILAVRQEIAATRYEVDDLRCLARIECLPVSPS